MEVSREELIAEIQNLEETFNIAFEKAEELKREGKMIRARLLKPEIKKKGPRCMMLYRWMMSLLKRSQNFMEVAEEAEKMKQKLKKLLEEE